MTGGQTPGTGQRVSDLLARLVAAIGSPQVTLDPAEQQLARQGLALLARQHAVRLGGATAAAVAARPHEVAPLDVRDQQGQVFTMASQASWPLQGTCGVCNEPVAQDRPGASWYHWAAHL